MPGRTTLGSAQALQEDLAPAASTTCERSHPLTDLVARAPCQLRRAHALPVRAARAPLRQQRPLEVRALGLCAFKWGAQLWQPGDAIAVFFWG